MEHPITHKRDERTGHMKQLVSPKELRRILRAQGESLARPKDFTDEDEWNVD